jgi:hypothetical protein
MALNVQGDLRRRMAEKFTDVKVSVTVPFDRPEKLIVVMRLGGHRRDDLVDAPVVGIYCYAPTEQEAWKLSNDVADFMARLQFAQGYITVENEAMYSDRDENTNSPRWYLSYSLLTYVVKGN